MSSRSGSVDLDHVLYGLPAHGTDAAAPALPLLQRALVAQAAVAATAEQQYSTGGGESTTV